MALGSTGQARRVADFLLAWHNAPENGGWDPTDLWNVDRAIGQDMLTVLQLASESSQYPGGLGFAPEIQAIWRLWRSPEGRSARQRSVQPPPAQPRFPEEPR